MAFTANAQAHFDALFHGLLPLIEERLLSAGEVEPFGVTLDAEGNGSIVAIRGLDLAVEKVQVILERLRDQARAGQLRACFIVTDVDVADPSGQRVSAICLSFEDHDGTARECFFPYRRPVEATVEYGKPFIMGRTPAVFVAT